MPGVNFRVVKLLKRVENRLTKLRNMRKRLFHPRLGWTAAKKTIT